MQGYVLLKILLKITFGSYGNVNPKLTDILR